MLDQTGIRQLAYLARVKEIKPIPGKDRVECAVINGWTCMTPKGAFTPGSLGIYFEIDSYLDYSKPEFAFLAKYKGKIKTQRYKNSDGSYFYSQGLLMAPADLGWKADTEKVIDEDGKSYKEGDFLTEKLGVTYAVEEDNKRKAKVNPDAKINAILAKHPKMAKKWGKFIKKHKWVRALVIFFFGHGVKKRTAWPAGCPKTDEERVESMPWILENKDNHWVATEKLDGSSATYYLARKGKDNYKVCSRNVVFDTPNKPCYYDTTEDGPGNIYLEIDKKYQMRDKLALLLKEFPDADWIAVQGEIFGAKVQKRDYSMTDRDFRVFNLRVSNKGRLGTLEMKDYVEKVGLKAVPVLATDYVLPDTIDELRAYVHSETSTIDGKIKEGIVFRLPDGSASFKCVDPEFLVQFHG